MSWFIEIVEHVEMQSPRRVYQMETENELVSAVFLLPNWVPLVRPEREQKVLNATRLCVGFNPANHYGGGTQDEHVLHLRSMLDHTQNWHIMMQAHFLGVRGSLHVVCPALFGDRNYTVRAHKVAHLDQEKTT
jgi:hypothetical protein